MSAGKSSVQYLQRPLHHLFQDVSWEELSVVREPGIAKVQEGLEEGVLTFERTVSRLLSSKLAHRVEADFATRHWHLAPARLRRRTRLVSLDNWRSQGLHGKCPTVHPGSDLNNGPHGCLHVHSFRQGQNHISPIKAVEGMQPY